MNKCATVPDEGTELVVTIKFFIKELEALKNK
jgi:hypothetical protein